MRKILVLAAGILMAGLVATGASALPGATRAPADAAESAVVQVHSGPGACHWVRGRWWRDTRPYSTPCYRGVRRWHRHCHCHWHHRHYWLHRHYY